VDGKAATSLNASSTNPAAGGTAERSGFTSFIALAADLKDLISADDSAVTINLNALSLYGLKNPDVHSALEIYRQHDDLRRLSGTFTFGAKVPESAITGLTGVPEAGKLLDVFVWDARYRVYGDRDARANRWYRDTLGTLAGINEIAATLPGLAPPHAMTLRALLEDAQGLALARFKARLASSAQVTIKTSGQHLTKESGRNKYTVGLLADKGFGDTDLTVNVLYSATDRIETTGAPAFRARNVTGSLALAGLVAEDAIVEGRSAELSFTANVDIPVQKGGPRADLETVWHLVAAITLPWGDSATIPISLMLASDPNNLKKQKYVIGHVGVAYDFGALKSLFK
jgi:hypothetical protein